MVAQSKLNHALKLLSSLEDMKTRSVICDFEVRVEGKNFPVHRSVLVACSKYFEGMLTSGMKEAQQGFVDMMNLNAEGVERCIDFMYTGEIKITSDSVRSIIEASHLIELHDLTEISLQHLRDNLNLKNCLQALEVFKIYGEDDDVMVVESMIIENFKEIIRFKMFHRIPKRDLIRYLENATIEPEVHWKATISWIERNEYKEDDFLMDALKSLLDFKETSLNFLFQVIWTDDTVQSCLKAKSLLLRSLSARSESLDKHLNVDISYKLLGTTKENELSNKDLVKKAVVKHLADNFEEATKNGEFVNLMIEELLDILRSTNLRAQEEVTKWEVITTWVQKNRSRSKHLLREIKFENLPADYIHQNIRGNLLVKKSAKCLEVVCDAIFAKQSQHAVDDSSESSADSTSLVTMDSGTGSLIEIDLNGGHHSEIAKFTKSKSIIVSISGNLYLIHERNIIGGYEIYEFNELGNWKLRSSTQLHLESWMIPVHFRNKIYLVGREMMACYDPNGNKRDDNLLGCHNFGGLCVAVTSDFIYALGGDNSNRAVRFDPESSKWTEICSMKEKRFVAAATSYRGNIWVAGGYDYPKYLSFPSVECYDSSTNSWQTIASMNQWRERFSLIIHNNKLYAVGGACDEEGDRLPKDSVEVYDQESKTWKIVAEMDKSKGIISSCVCDTTLIQRHQ